MTADRGEKADRRAARELIGDYHETELARLLEHVRAGFARLRRDLDAFELDELIHRYKRSTSELWKLCESSWFDAGHAAAATSTAYYAMLYVARALRDRDRGSRGLRLGCSLASRSE